MTRGTQILRVVASCDREGYIIARGEHTLLQLSVSRSGRLKTREIDEGEFTRLVETDRCKIKEEDELLSIEDVRGSLGRKRVRVFVAEAAKDLSQENPKLSDSALRDRAEGIFRARGELDEDELMQLLRSPQESLEDSSYREILESLERIRETSLRVLIKSAVQRVEERRDFGLVKEYREGRKEALGELIERHYAAILSVAKRLKGNREDAEGLANEVVIQVARSLDTYQKGNFRGWVVTIANRCVWRFIRRGVATDQRELEYERRRGQDPIAPFDQKDREAVIRIWCDCSDADREILDGLFVEGLSYRRLARKLKKNPKTLKKDVEKLLKNLRAGLVAHREGVGS